MQKALTLQQVNDNADNVKLTFWHPHEEIDLMKFFEYSLILSKWQIRKPLHTLG